MGTANKTCPKCGAVIGKVKRMKLLNAICLFIGRMVVLFSLFTLAMFIFKWLGKVCSTGFNWAYGIISTKYVTFLVIISIVSIIAIISHFSKNKKDNEPIQQPEEDLCEYEPNDYPI